MGTQQLCLKWNKHYSNLLDISEHLLSSEVLVDVTLACEGLLLKAHKLVLSACSPFFQSIFVDNPCQHPVIILKGVSYADLKAIIEFMYRGEVSVSRDQLAALLETAQMLQVRGLAEGDGDDGAMDSSAPSAPASATRTAPPSQDQTRSPASRRKRRKRRVADSGSDSNHSDNEQVPCLKIEDPESPDVISIDDKDNTVVPSAPSVTESRGGDSTSQQQQPPPPPPKFPSSVPTQESLSQPSNFQEESQHSNTAASGADADQATDSQSDSASGIKIEHVNVMDPSEFMEQTLEVDSVSKHHQSSVHGSSGSSPQVPSFTITSVRTEDVHGGRTDGSSVSETHAPRTVPQPHLSRTVLSTQSSRTVLESQHHSKVVSAPQSLRTTETSHYRSGMSEADMGILVPFCISSESSAGSMNETANQDSVLVSASHQDASGTSLAGPSQQPDGVEGGDSMSSGGALMMFSDNSGVPSVAGPSGYQLDVQSAQQIQGGSSQGQKVQGKRHRFFPCRQCTCVCKSEEKFREHQRSHLSPQSEFHCRICGKPFTWYRSLLTHYRKRICLRKSLPRRACTFPVGRF